MEFHYVPCGNTNGERNDKICFYTFGMLKLLADRSHLDERLRNLPGT
ncbi:hypothetical protein [Nostoc sp. ChiQUE01b]|nr:hypothetical protein [Nostoc sp. ChiQUE01b]